MQRIEITDDDRAAWRAGKETGFAATLQDTMQATGAAPKPTAPEPPTPRSFGRREIAMIVAGLVVALIAVVLVSRAAPTASTLPTIAATPTAQPTTEQRPLMVYDTIQTAIPEPSPTEAPTATPEPPTQTPAVVYIEVAPPCDPANPPYVVEQEVRDDRGIPLGIVTGTSCESQDAARANADALAEEMKGKQP